MTLDNGWMIVMVAMFGVFLVGIWMEARRSLRALLEDDFGINEVVACEADYDAILTRLEARSRLSQIRSSMTQPVAAGPSATVNQTATYGLVGGSVAHSAPRAEAPPSRAETPRLARKRRAPQATGTMRDASAGHNRMARHRLPHQPVVRQPVARHRVAQRPLSHNGFNLG